jgi:hypothetical protein
MMYATALSSTTLHGIPAAVRTWCVRMLRRVSSYLRWIPSLLLLLLTHPRHPGRASDRLVSDDHNATIGHRTRHSPVTYTLTRLCCLCALKIVWITVLE